MALFWIDAFWKECDVRTILTILSGITSFAGAFVTSGNVFTRSSVLTWFYSLAFVYVCEKSIDP